MIGYGIVALLILLPYVFFTWSVLVDPAITRGHRIFRLALVWLLPVLGLCYVVMLYRQDNPNPGDEAWRNELR